MLLVQMSLVGEARIEQLSQEDERFGFGIQVND